MWCWRVSSEAQLLLFPALVVVVVVVVVVIGIPSELSLLSAFEHWHGFLAAMPRRWQATRWRHGGARVCLPRPLIHPLSKRPIAPLPLPVRAACLHSPAVGESGLAGYMRKL